MADEVQNQQQTPYSQEQSGTVNSQVSNQEIDSTSPQIVSFVETKERASPISPIAPLSKKNILPRPEIELIEDTLYAYEWEHDYEKYTVPMFDLVRRLMAYPSLKDKRADEAADIVESRIDHWSDLAGIDDDEIGRDQFISCWQAVTSPRKLGKEAFVVALQNMEEQGILPVKRPSGKATVRFTKAVNICYRLQEVEGDAPMALSCRAFGEMMGVHFTDADLYLRRMVREGFLTIVEPARKKMQRATRYRFIGLEVNGRLFPA